MDKNAITDEDKEKIIETLKRIGLIDDLRFAKAYTNDKINLSLDLLFTIKKIYAIICSHPNNKVRNRIKGG